jgi:hypothetical protein
VLAAATNCHAAFRTKLKGDYHGVFFFNPMKVSFENRFNEQAGVV